MQIVTMMMTIFWIMMFEVDDLYHNGGNSYNDADVGYNDDDDDDDNDDDDDVELVMMFMMVR